VLSLIFCKLRCFRADRLKASGDEVAYSDYVYNVVTNWAVGRLKSSGSTVKINGLENLPEDKHNILFVSNHQSNFDIILLLAKLPVKKGFIAKKELGNIPSLSDWMRRINCLFMDRKDMRQSAQTIVEGIKLLKGGYNMVIFPEGTRSKGGPHRSFKAGSFKLATKAGSTIVPLTIEGTAAAMEANGGRIKPSEIILTIHKPISVKEMDKEERTKLPEKVEQIVFGE
jgi:1-acyl-sn-glycerol-3-phosphate acyltransferase